MAAKPSIRIRYTMTQHGAQNGLAASEQHLLQLIRQFADVINHETDYLARVESELKSSISERRAEIDKQRRIKLTELSNRATAESIAAKENIHDLARKLGLNPQSGVPQFLYLGDIEPLKVAGLTDQISKIPMMLPLFDQGGVAVIADEERGLEVIASMVFRAVDKARPRSVSVHLLNPSLLDEMSVFSALNSGGSNEFGSASTSEDIEQILTFLAERIQENMQLLQGEYRHLGDYLARRSGRDRHRYHLLCVAGKAKSFEGYMPQILQLMKQGPRYGVSTLIQIEPDALPELIDPLKDLEFAKLLVLLKSVNELKVSALVGGESFTVEAPQLSNSASRTRLNVLAQQGANLKPPVVSLVGTLPKFMWREDSRDGLRVSLGEQGDQSAEIVIGDSGRNLNNVLVGGAAGSGKTVLLLTLIYGLAYRYSPDELMMYLLDYKEGVEFARFASGETYLPHARIIGIESDKALGTSVLASLIDEIGSRSKLFKEVGAEKLSEYREKTRKKLPRILLVVDEFQLERRSSSRAIVRRSCGALVSDIAGH